MLFQCYTRKAFIAFRREKVSFIHSFIEKYILGDRNSSYAILKLYEKVFITIRKKSLIYSIIRWKIYIRRYQQQLCYFDVIQEKRLLGIEQKSVIHSFIHSLKSIY